MHYLIITQYKIRPKCSTCGDNVDCYCYSEYKDAINGLFKSKWACNKVDCLYELHKDSQLFIESLNKCNGDIKEAIDDLLEKFCEMDCDGDEGLCEIFDEYD